MNPVPPDKALVEKALSAALDAWGAKVVVLDDDPTGVQTVHGVSVYTDGSLESLREGFGEPGRLFFVLTNSRGMTVPQTTALHRDIARNLVRVASETGREYLLISRSDSTLRGHYPLETAVLREEIEAATGHRFDGEVLFPFFPEGGRLTRGNVHYVKEGETLVPAGETEFARDLTFGYRSSHLGEWAEEKTGGAFRAAEMTYVPLESLRQLPPAGVIEQLTAVSGFQKVIVNALEYSDVEVFALAFLEALRRGKRFLVRSAAAFPRVIGGISPRPLLSKDELIAPDAVPGGLVLVGSHVKKTSQQLEELRRSPLPLVFLEFDQHRVLESGGLESEVRRLLREEEALLANGTTVVIHTRRERLDLEGGDKDRQLEVAVRISDALTSLVGRLTLRPAFIIAKGGITSSDVGTKALGVRRALVMGQILPGIPVWKTGPESKFPDLPFIIFPGNVGDVGALRRIVESLHP